MMEPAAIIELNYATHIEHLIDNQIDLDGLYSQLTSECFSLFAHFVSTDISLD